MNLDLTFLRGKTVTCAVSGGADSVALLHMLYKAREELGLSLSAAHYNHCLRSNADADEAFVRELCAVWNIPLEVGRGDVAAYAKANGMSVEEAARKLRYDFLMAQPGLIATAHNADDQVETVLLNLVRGTGLMGLCAMQKQTDRIVRPILELTRQQIEDYLAEHGLSHREDETNGEDDALRNRLRHHVLPLLRQENPSLAQSIGRMTMLLQQDEEYLQEQTRKLLKEAAQDGGYNCRVLRKSPLCQRAVRSLLQIPKPSMSHVQAVCALMEDLSGSKQVQLPGMIVRRQYDVLYFGKEIESAPQAVTVDAGKAGSLRWGKWSIAWESCEGSFLVRSRREGDKIRLSCGSRSIKKLLIDKKIPATERDLIPVVEYGGQIVAVGDLVCRMEQLHIEERRP